MYGSTAVAWSSKKQPRVTLSTTEAEFIVVASCACQAFWLRRLLNELHCSQYESTLIYCDNSLAVKLSKIQVMHGRSKHIDVRFHFLQELTKKDGVLGSLPNSRTGCKYSNKAIEAGLFQKDAQFT